MLAGARASRAHHLAAVILLFELCLQAARKVGVCVKLLLLAQRADALIEQRTDTHQRLGQVAEPRLRVGAPARVAQEQHRAECQDPPPPSAIAARAASARLARGALRAARATRASAATHRVR